jgi:hypothetical protein
VFPTEGTWHVRLRWAKPSRAEWTLAVPVRVAAKGKIPGGDGEAGALELHSPRPFDHVLVNKDALFQGIASPILPGAKVSIRLAKIWDELGHEGDPEGASSNVQHLVLDPEGLKKGFKWGGGYFSQPSVWGIRFRWDRPGAPWSAERRIYIEPPPPALSR